RDRARRAAAAHRRDLPARPRRGRASRAGRAEDDGQGAALALAKREKLLERADDAFAMRTVLSMQMRVDKIGYVRARQNELGKRRAPQLRELVGDPLGLQLGDERRDLDNDRDDVLGVLTREHVIGAIAERYELRRKKVRGG